MGALLASFGIKDAVYAALILALGGAGLWYHHHIVMEGEQVILASDAKAVAAAKQRDDALTTTAALANSIAQGDYTHEIAVPVSNAPVPVGLCRTARSSGSVPAAASSTAGGDSTATGGDENAGAVAELQHFADAAVQIARDDDAQVAALQTILANIRHEMENTNVR